MSAEARSRALAIADSTKTPVITFSLGMKAYSKSNQGLMMMALMASLAC